MKQQKQSALAQSIPLLLCKGGILALTFFTMYKGLIPCILLLLHSTSVELTIEHITIIFLASLVLALVGYTVWRRAVRKKKAKALMHYRGL